MTDEEGWDGAGMTDAEAEAAWDAAEPIPLSAERIKQIVDYAVGRGGEERDAMTNIDDEILKAAVKKAVEVGLLPRSGCADVGAKHWDGLEAVVAAEMEDAMAAGRAWAAANGYAVREIEHDEGGEDEG